MQLRGFIMTKIGLNYTKKRKKKQNKENMNSVRRNY